MARKLRPAIELVSSIGSLGYDLQHHQDAAIEEAVVLLRTVNPQMFDWLSRVLGQPPSSFVAVEKELAATYREIEREMLRRLSDALTDGNAGTWQEIEHAAASHAETIRILKEEADLAHQALDELAVTRGTGSPLSLGGRIWRLATTEADRLEDKIRELTARLALAAQENARLTSAILPPPSSD